MTQSEIMANLLEISENSYYRWKKKDHVKLIKLIEQYFTDSEIEEFLDTGKINKFDNLNKYSLSSCINFLNKLSFLNQKLDFFKDDLESKDKDYFLSKCYDDFSDFIIHLISLYQNQNASQKENIYHTNNTTLFLFKNIFTEFIIDRYNNAEDSSFKYFMLNELTYSFNFINNFTKLDLIFLEINIFDNFKTLSYFVNNDKYDDYFDKEKDNFFILEQSLIKNLKNKLLSINSNNIFEDNISLHNLIIEYKNKITEEVKKN